MDGFQNYLGEGIKEQTAREGMGQASLYGALYQRTA